jgi:hypothetical protein
MTTREKYESILKYISKNYEIKNDRIWDLNDPHEVKGDEISKSLITIFDYGKWYCDYCLKKWALNNGLPEKEWGKAYWKGLRVTWSPEMIQDLQAFHNIDAEAELTALVSQEIANEIDNEILNNLFGLRNEG